MPDYIYVGSGLATLEQVNATLVIDKLGVGEATLEFTTAYATAVDYAMSLTVHPDYPWLVRVSATIKREEADMGRVTLTYKGISPEYAETVQRVYSLEGCLSTEPIESHPDFETFAGTPAIPLTGAKFDLDGLFTGFSANDQPADVNKRKTGVRSYQMPSFMLTEVIVRPYGTVSGYSPSTPSSMAALGCIDTPPANSLVPQLHSKRSWMLWSLDIEDLGNGTRETRRWRLSGPRGWDTDIYKTTAINQ